MEIVLEIILTPFSFGWMPSLKFNSGFKATSWSKKGINKRLNLEENFDQEIEDLNQETENLVSEIEKWQM